MTHPVVIGAVAYDARVVPIWEGIKDYFHQAGMAVDYVLFSNYDAQVSALLKRHIDIAWNTNLAWVKLHMATGGTCRALAMRDVDADFTTVMVARRDSGIQSLHDLRGKRVALGSADSAQAAILPLHYIKQAGLEPISDCALERYDLDVGKHGDTGTSELEVLKALIEGRADAGALGDATWVRQVSEGLVPADALQVFFKSPGYCHCNFSVLGDFNENVAKQWTQLLLAMKYDNPKWREVMDMEGVKKWIPADTAGYQVLFDAVEEQDLASTWTH